jgi:hypothetical protein
MAFARDQYTVFVLGAGASSHYGYPLGEELIDDIISSIKISVAHHGGFKTRNITIGEHHVPEKYMALRNRLEYFSPLSIDAFLRYESFPKKEGSKSANVDIVSTGKHLITLEILGRENHKLCLNKRHKHPITKKTYSNWYRYLYHALISDTEPENFLDEEPNFSVVTFNYDVSLEHYLFTRLHASNIFEDKKLNSFFENVLSKKIIHIYGQVDKYKWQGGQRGNFEYGCMRDEDLSYWKNQLFFKADTLKDNIFVIGDERTNIKLKEVHIQAQSELAKAKNIFFLGFGFADENIKVLDLKQSCQYADRIFYTNKDNSAIIGSKADDIFKLQNRNRVVRPSERDVYGALTYDFELTHTNNTKKP